MSSTSKLTAAIILKAMRKRILLPALNFLSDKTGSFVVSPDTNQETKSAIFTKEGSNSADPALRQIVLDIHPSSIMTDLVVSSLFELATGTAKVIKITTAGGIVVSTLEEYPKPEFQAIKFYLENVDPTNWKDRQGGGTTQELIEAVKLVHERKAKEADAANQ